MISVNDIATEIQQILGDKFKLYVDNNASVYEIADQEMDINEQMNQQSDKIIALMTTSAGEIVALKDLFSTSFGYMIQFLTPTNTNIESDLNRVIQALNGVLNSVGTDKYLLTFNSPTAIGSISTVNGNPYQEIRMSGNIAITNNSYFGNEFQVTIDGVSVNGLINADLSLSPENNVNGNIEGSLIPQYVTPSVGSAISMVVHMRKDSTLYETLLDYHLNPNLLLNKYFSLGLTIGTKNTTWNTNLNGSNISFAVGGYAILSISFVQSQVI